MSKPEDILTQHYKTISAHMTAARIAAVKAVRKVLKNGDLINDPDGAALAIRAIIAKALAPYIKQAIADGQRKGKEIGGQV